MVSSMFLNGQERNGGGGLNAYTIRGKENLDVIKERLAYISSRATTTLSMRGINETFDMSSADYEAQSAELLVLCERHMYPPNLGYANYGSGRQMDMRIDPGAVGLSRICHAARRDSALVYFSGTGADEIISDYGFDGTKLTPHSSFGGKFPENLTEVFPWYNFFGGTQRAYLMKEELVAGSYGIEARYPFLDVDVVQEFLWLKADVMNSEYKRPIADLLRTLSCPFDANKKVGFSANPSADDEKVEAKRGLASDPWPLTRDPECPNPGVDFEGILAYASTTQRKIEVLEHYASKYVHCPEVHVRLAEGYFSSASDRANLLAGDSYRTAVAAESDVDKKKSLCGRAALALFSRVKVPAAVEFLVTAVETPGQTPNYIYNTMATAFMGNSPLFLNPSFELSASDVAELETSLSRVLKNHQLVKDTKFAELCAYALAAVQHVFSGDSTAASSTIRKHIISTNGLTPTPLPEAFLHYVFHAGGSTPLKVATVATTPKPELFNMVNSGAIAGVSVDVLGLGEEWEGNPTKVKMYRAYVSRMESDQLVLLADAYDVLLSPELRKIVNVYEERWEGKILFGGEVRCWPDASFEPLYPPSSSQFRFLNSGSYLGRAGAVLKMLDEALGYASLLVSDQRAFTRYMLLNPEQVSIDEDAEVFRSLHMHASVPGANLEFDYDNFIATAGDITNYPLLVHGNGNDGNRYYATIAKTMFQASDTSFDFSEVPTEKIRDNVRIASLGGPLSISDLDGVIAVANEMAARGRFDEGAKTLYWGYVSTKNPAILTEYARWFAGEACAFCTSSVKDPALPRRLRTFLDRFGRYSMGGDEWRELTEFNIAVTHHWLGEKDQSTEAYRKILEKASDIGSVAEGGDNEVVQEVTDSTPLHIAAVATQDRPELSNLVNSAQVHGLVVDVLGMGDVYLGNSQKVAYFGEYTSNLPSNDLVLLVDAYDVLLFSGANALKGNFAKSGCKVLFAGETSSYPDLGIAPLYQDGNGDAGSAGPHKYLYLNSGVILGRAGDLCKMMATVSSYKSLYLSDQRSFVRYYLTHRSSVSLDHSGTLFATLHGVTEHSIVSKGPKFALGDARDVAVVHGNAGGLGGKKFYEEIANAMITVAKSNEPEAVVEVPPPLYSSAVASYKKGDITRAIDLFKKNLVGDPEHVESLYNLGVIYAETKNWDSARSWYEECLSIDERYLNCIVNLGECLSRGHEANSKATESPSLMFVPPLRISPQVFYYWKNSRTGMPNFGGGLCC